VRPSKAVRDSVRAYRRALPWALLLLPGFVALQFYRWDAAARETFALHEAEVKEEIARIQARDIRRAPILEPAAPGNAWECYAAAFDTIGRIPRGGMTGNPVPSAAELALLDASYGPVVDLLREGQRREEVEIPWEAVKGCGNSHGRLIPTYTLAKDICRLARGLHGAGKDSCALKALLALLETLPELRRGMDLCLTGWTLGGEAMPFVRSWRATRSTPLTWPPSLRASNGWRCCDRTSASPWRS
jgi:hypothetical protein